MTRDEQSAIILALSDYFESFGRVPRPYTAELFIQRVKRFDPTTVCRALVEMQRDTAAGRWTPDVNGVVIALETLVEFEADVERCMA